MKRLSSLFCCLFFLSCNSDLPIQKEEPLKVWILKNQQQLIFDSNLIIEANYNLDANRNWGSITMGISQYQDNSLGQLARLAGDTTECFDIFLTFYKDPAKKRKILLGPTDSTCLKIFENLEFPTDSTTVFIFGKEGSI